MGELVPHDREVLVVRNVLKVEDDRTLTRQRDPAVRHRQQAGVRAAHPEDLLQPEGEAGARGERVDRWSAGEASAELLLQRRDVALDGLPERATPATHRRHGPSRSGTSGRLTKYPWPSSHPSVRARSRMAPSSMPTATEMRR